MNYHILCTKTNLCLLVFCLVAAVGWTRFRHINLSRLSTNLKINGVEPDVFDHHTCHSLIGRPFHEKTLRLLHYASSNTSSAYQTIEEARRNKPISSNYSNLTEFILVIREALLSRRLAHQGPMIPIIFHDPPFNDMVKPSCDGLWMEFGVFKGRSLTHAAKWKARYCGTDSDPIYGFDTFSGLPTDWRPGFGRGTFRLNEHNLPETPPNSILVKGLFIDTLPNYLRSMDVQYGCRTPVAYLHIDCDIYDGARDVLFLVGSRLVPGSIIIFDELFNYPTYEKHEIKAFYEFMASSRLLLIPIGSATEIRLDVVKQSPIQSFAFVVTSKEENGIQ